MSAALPMGALDALGVQRAAALLAAELAGEHGQRWQQEGRVVKRGGGQS